MFKIATRNLFAHKLRLLITAGAVVLGIGFVVGTFVLTDTLGKIFDDLIESTSSEVDAVIRGTSPFDASSGPDGPGTSALRAEVDPALLPTIREVPGVRVAELAVVSVAQVLGSDGKPVTPANGPPALGFNWSDEADLNPWTLAEGRAPREAGEVAVNRSVLEDGGFAIGDRISIQTLTGPLQARIVGVLTFEGRDNAVGASGVAFDVDTALRVLTPSGKAQEIDVVGEPDVAQATLVRDLREVLGDDVEVISGSENTAEQQDAVRSQLTLFNRALQVFAGISLLAGIFLIYNTFGIVVAQRTRELALLRALGAGGRQVFSSVLAEAALTGLLASVVGIGFGLGLAWLLTLAFEAFGADLPAQTLVLLPRTVVIALVVGLLATTLSAVLPARRASRVAPLAALRESAVERTGVSLVRIAIGAVFALIGVVGLVTGVSGSELLYVGVGVFGLFVAAVVLGPLLVPLVTGSVGRLVPGLTGHLARGNLVRNPKRAASTSSSLILALTIITMFTIFLVSFAASINAAVDRDLKATFQIDSGTFQSGGLSPAFAEQVRALPDVAAVSGIRRGTFGLDGDAKAWFGVSGPDLGSLLSLGEVEGSLADLGAGTIAVDRETATDEGWALGDEVPTQWVDGSINPLRIVAIYEDGGIVAQADDGRFLVDQSVFDAAQPANLRLDNRVLVLAAEGADVERVRTSIEGVARGYGSPEVRDKEQIKDEQNKAINQQLAVFGVLLAMSVVIGAIGIVNTLVLSVMERTRELGLLRAIGAERGRVARVILVESVLVAVFGVLLGFLIGTAGGAAFMQALAADIDTATIRVPIPVIVAYGVVAIAIGTAAGLYPAWRAARLNVLEAIATE